MTNDIPKRDGHVHTSALNLPHAHARNAHAHVVPRAGRAAAQVMRDGSYTFIKRD